MCNKKDEKRFSHVAYSDQFIDHGMQPRAQVSANNGQGPSVAFFVFL